MKFLDLEAQYLSIQKDIDRAIAGVIHESSFVMGTQVEELEGKMAKYIGVKHAIGLNSGSDALTASLIALGIKDGDEVIVPSFTYIATAEAVAIAGSKIVFVDVDPETFNIDPKQIENAITKNTKAIIPVHLYGQPADMDAIMDIAQKHKLYIIEDAAQAIGAEWDGKKVGSFGDTGCLSFFPTKNLGAYGDGGMVVTNNDEIANYIRMWRQHGQSKKYYTDFVGASSRLDNLQAAILLAKLPYLDSWNEQRRTIARTYDETLKTNQNIKTPVVDPKAKHIYHQYTIHTERRDELQRHLIAHEIPTMIYYPVALHKQKAYSDAKQSGTLIISEKLSKNTLSLPIYPELTRESSIKIAQIINAMCTTREINHGISTI